MPMIELDYRPLHKAIPIHSYFSAKGWLIFFAVIVGGGALIWLGAYSIRSGLFGERSDAIDTYGWMIGLGAFMILGGFFDIITVVPNRRFKEFVRINGLRVDNRRSFRSRPGMIFNQIGKTKYYRRVYIGEGERQLELGSMSVGSSSKNDKSEGRSYGYMCLRLPRKLPNIILDAKHNDFLGRRSSTPRVIAKTQRISLEGNFDDYFDLYAPSTHRIDALYVFTPDVMQAVMSSAYKYDCEIVDNYFYVYRIGGFPFSDQTMYKDMFRIADVVEREVLKQTHYYADQRIDDRTRDVVAKSGRRLTVGNVRKNYMLAGKIILFLLSFVAGWYVLLYL